jgi:hypothetical protein
MITKKTLFILVIVLSMASIIYAQSKATIVFVTYGVVDTTKIDTATGEYADMEHVHALEDAGYEVIQFYNGELTSASDETMDTLYNANLIVMGRSTPSTGYGDHKQAWNELSTPILCLEMWACRSSRLNWFSTENIGIYNLEDTVYNAMIQMPDDPVFEVLDDDLDLGNPVPWIVSPGDGMGVTEAGNGIVLATMEGTNNVLFVRFEPDVEFYDGAGDWPAGHRTMIGNGRDEGGLPPFNYYNFTPESEAVFLAEVKRMVALGGFVDAVEGQENPTIPSTMVLSQNYPNPFNPSTIIPFDLAEKSHVRLTLSNILGEEIMEIADGEYSAGHHEIVLNAGNLAAGVYFYKIETGTHRSVRKLLLVK